MTLLELLSDLVATNFLFKAFFGSIFFVKYSQVNSQFSCQMIQAIIYICVLQRKASKKTSTVIKFFLAYFDHYNFINKKELVVQFWYENTILN